MDIEWVKLIGAAAIGGRIDGVKEACGVFGIYAPGVEVSHLVFDGLFALQHRGQESAGMAVSDGQEIVVSKEMGLVTSAFDARKLASLTGHLALGHVRYSTGGASTWQNAQPVYRSIGENGFALGHNGNLTNVAELEEEQNMLPGISSSDSDLVAELMALTYDELHNPESPDTLEEVLNIVLPRLWGAFSFGLIDTKHLIGVRDPNGFRPLCLGRLDPTEETPGGWVIASESPALDIVGARFVRELEPGEMVIIDEDGPRSSYPFPKERIDPRLCVFEFVYFARPDTKLFGKEIHAARHRMGQQLAEESFVDADIVLGVPDSGVPAAEGFAASSGIPFGQGLVKNRYIGRTFIAPTHEARINAVRRKLNPLRESVEGKRLVVVDDSVVRGTTTGQIVRMLKEAGALEVHLRISSPPFAWPCFYGIDTPSRGELLAANMSQSEMADFLQADSVAFLSLEGLYKAIDAGDAGLCNACLTGHYPTPTPVSITERPTAAALS
jgi:amidophosphoribosyltransferase